MDEFGGKPRCIAQTANDTRCKNAARIGSEYCQRHSPERAQERSEAARKAAQTRNAGTTLALSREAAEIKAKLRTLTEDLLSEELSPGVGAVVIQAWNTVLRAVELERRTIELEEALPAIEEIKEQYKQRDKASGYHGPLR